MWNLRGWGGAGAEAIRLASILLRCSRRRSEFWSTYARLHDEWCHDHSNLEQFSHDLQGRRRDFMERDESAQWQLVNRAVGDTPNDQRSGRVGLEYLFQLLPPISSN